MLWKLKQRQQKWLAEEKGTIHKDWGGKVRIALAFPNRYAVGMSNLGFHAVYEILNRLDHVVCERVFYPEPEDLTILRERPIEAGFATLDFTRQARFLLSIGITDHPLFAPVEDRDFGAALAKQVEREKIS